VGSYPSSPSSFLNAPGLRDHHQHADRQIYPHNYIHNTGDLSSSPVNYVNPLGRETAQAFPGIGTSQNHTPNYNSIDEHSPGLQVVNHRNSPGHTPTFQQSNFGVTQQGSPGTTDPNPFYPAQQFLSVPDPHRSGQHRPHGPSRPTIQTSRPRSLSQTSTRPGSVRESRVSKSNRGPTSPIHPDFFRNLQVPPSFPRSPSVSSATSAKGRRNGALSAEAAENANLVDKSRSVCVGCKLSKVTVSQVVEEGGGEEEEEERELGPR